MNHLTLLIKPASSLCNMRCKYCFYHDVAEHRDTNSHGIMDRATTDWIIERAFEYVESPGVLYFAFQGGEPTMAGLEYFKYFTKKVNQANKKQIQVQYSIQTNGQLINEDFCNLFKEYDFLVGLSQDGPREIHDVNRLDINNKGTFDQTNRAIKLMEQYNVEYNILTVITKQVAKKPQTLFRYYQKKNFKYVQLIPCLTSLGSDVNDMLQKFTLTPREYARFLIDICNLWYEAFLNNDYISVRLFDNLVLMLKDQPPEQCGLLGFCSIQCVVEADGSIYPCDFYALDKFKLGSIHDNTLQELLTPATAHKFLSYEVDKHPLCEKCKVYNLCRGGCKRYRSFYAMEKDYCPYQDFLYHSMDKLMHVAKLVR